MKKYYLMSIDKGNTNAMLLLGSYYKDIKNNYDLMKKYYLMAIDKGNKSAMLHLGSYYKNIERNYDLMKKYFLLYHKYTNCKEDIIYIIRIYKLHNYYYL
jgi:TPR repeat protein